MNGFQTTLIALAVVLATGNVQAQTALDALPIRDGVYVRDQSHCEAFQNDKLDMIEFEVTNEGRSFNYPDTACVVASAEPLSSGRLSVEADCSDMDGISHHQFFLDVLPEGEIRMNGDPSYFCPLTAAARSIRTDALIAEWDLANENCRGGLGDDPDTQVACERREAFVSQLQSLGWCYGSASGGPRSDFDWYQC